ncbi:MAG: YfiR/HmsC family protein [bacterium]
MLATALLLLPLQMRAGNAEVDPANYIPLFLKIVTYDEQFGAGELPRLKIGILYDKSDPESYRQYLAVERYFEETKDLSLAEKTVAHEAVAIASLDAYIGGLSTLDYNILIVTNLRREQVKKVVVKTQMTGILSFSLVPEHVALGVSVAVDPQRKGKTILVNLESSRREGARFSAHLLRLCEIVGG